MHFVPMMPTKFGAVTARICESDVWMPSPASVKKGSFDDNYFKKGVDSGLLVRDLNKGGDGFSKKLQNALIIFLWVTFTPFCFNLAVYIRYFTRFHPRASPK